MGDPNMNWHDKRVKYGIIVTVVLFAIIAFQIAFDCNREW